MSESSKEYRKKVIDRIEDADSDKVRLSELAKQFPEIGDLIEDEHPSSAFLTDSQFESPDPANSEELEPQTHNVEHEPVIDVESREKSLRESLKMKADDTATGQIK
jgi:hypothetical protein